MRSAPFSLLVAPGLQFDFARIPIKTPPIQRKPTISSPGDAYEREADEVADKVMQRAEPVIFPAIEMGAALARGAMDGIITSPGGWGKNVQDAPRGSLVPGLLFYTYFLIADKAWFDALPAAGQKALAEAARATVTDKWGEMQADDARLVADLVARGASQSAVPADALAPWRARTESVTRAFAAAHPEVMRRFRSVVGAE